MENANEQSTVFETPGGWSQPLVPEQHPGDGAWQQAGSEHNSGGSGNGASDTSMRAASAHSRDVSPDDVEPDKEPPSHSDDPEAVRIFPDKTFGVEFEFLVLCERSTPVPVASSEYSSAAFPTFNHAEFENEISDRARVSMINTLRNQGISCNSYRASRADFSTDRWTVDHDGSVQTQGELGADKPSITFANGETHYFREGDRERLFLHSVEVKSRILPANDNSLAEIEVALAVLRSFPTLVNWTCGFHVHIGQGLNGFDLRTLKNILTLGCVAQKQINELHSADRINRDYCQLPTMAFEPEDRTPDAMVEHIDRIPTVRAFIDFVHIERPDRATLIANPAKERFHAYNFMNLGPYAPYQTIEFRQADGTLDGPAARRWVLFVCALVLQAQLRPCAFTNAMWDVQNDPDLAVLDLLEALGMSDLATLYQGHTYNHDDVVVQDPHEGWRERIDGLGGRTVPAPNVAGSSGQMQPTRWDEAAGIWVVGEESSPW